MRAVTVHVIATERPKSPRQDPVVVASEWYKGDSAVERLTRDVEPIERGWLIRAGVSPTDTASAPALVQTLTEYLLQSLAPISAAAILLRKTLQLKFNGFGKISVPSFMASVSYASFVGQGRPVPVYSLATSPLVLEPAKLANVALLTDEMISGSGGNAEAMVKDTLMRSIGLNADAALFDANPAIPEERPAGLRNGITASPASTATDPAAAMIADIETLTGVVAVVSGTDPIILVAAPARARTMPLRSFTLATGQSFAILPSNAVAPDDLIAIAPSAVVSATGSIEVGVSTDAVLHMSDTPTDLGTAGTPNVPATPAKSLFQTNCVGLRPRLELTWARRHPASVAWLTTTAW
ncbi:MULTISPECIES: hypothetical protein [unclassified Bradyrhizobium]